MCLYSAGSMYVATHLVGGLPELFLKSKIAAIGFLIFIFSPSGHKLR